MDRRYFVAVVLLAVLAVAFGVFGTFAPPLAEEGSPVQPQQESPSESVGHFQNPPTYDGGWMDITDKLGQSFTLTHNLNTSEVIVDVVGRQSLTGEDHKLFFGSTVYLPELNRTYGGTGYDYPRSLIETRDGGYAIAGEIEGPGANDFWLVKTDFDGNMQWNRTYGGWSSDVASSVVQTRDGGYAIAGGTDTYGAGLYDFLLVKTDSAGNVEWIQTYGGGDRDNAHSLIATSDGGYALAGYTASYGLGGWDFWLVKTDSKGNAQWNRTSGGAGDDEAYSVVETSDGGFALAGETWSSGEGDPDFWLVKVDSIGNVQWNRTYEGGSYERCYSMIETSDKGFALAGFYAYDFGLVKTDSAGNVEWTKKYGGYYSDDAYSVIQTDDGGFALAGRTENFGSGGYNSPDFWLVKTDFDGNMQWNKTFGGPGYDVAYSVVQTSYGTYALAGSTDFYGAGGSDFWLVSTSMEFGSSIGLSMTALTNSTIRLYRGSNDPFWNYVRVRIWLIKEPSWMNGDINMDGKVDAKDLYILGRSYGKTFSLLSLTGIIAIAGIRTIKKRKQTG